ncbi:hypothetical protein ACFW9N_02525 [Streptomyces sp. NPDC059496]|uniref:hypothetical protein n=1 Tax=Streptomyces sp. NPDC059496 TaxID=3346851 RepID=UPI0036AE1CEC
MDEYEEFRQLARATVRNLQDAGKSTIAISAENGSVEGWIVDMGNSYSSESIYSNAPGDFKEVWGNNNRIILGVDGEFYNYSWGAEEGGCPVVKKEHNSLDRMGPSDLVGNDGKPFSVYAAKMSRLRWAR